MKTEEIIYTEKIPLSQAKNKIEPATLAANNLLFEAEKILGELDPEEKLELLKSGIKFVREQLKDKFLFPNASDEFNLNSLGVDLTKVSSIKLSLINEFDFSVGPDGKFIPNEFQPYLDSFVHRVKTDKQKKAVELASNIMQVVNELDSEGLNHGQSADHVARAFPKLFKTDLGRPAKLVLNNQEICKYLK